MAQCGTHFGHSPRCLCANGPIDNDDMYAAVWCWKVQILVDYVKCNCR